MVKRVVVTGASGKVGRPTVYELLEHVYDVLAVDRIPFPDPKVLLAEVHFVLPPAFPAAGALA